MLLAGRDPLNNSGLACVALSFNDPNAWVLSSCVELSMGKDEGKPSGAVEGIVGLISGLKPKGGKGNLPLKAESILAIIGRPGPGKGRPLKSPNGISPGWKKRGRRKFNAFMP